MDTKSTRCLHHFLPGATLLGAMLALALPPPGLEAAGAARSPPPQPVRGIWVTRWDFKTEADVRRAVRWCAALGLNRIFFQVRGRADAFYRSHLEPWGEEIGGKDPGFDPLEVALAQARSEKIELHAWINVLPAWKGSKPPENPRHVLHTHPDWFLVDRRGELRLTDPADYTILNPCLPEVRAYLTAVVRDIARRYDVDGIHFDYARFVGRNPERGDDFPYDHQTLAHFRKYCGSSPFEAPGEWDRWRRLAVNTLVRDLSREVREARPRACISAAAIKDFVRAREGLFQDVAAWQARGWVDEIYPMAYDRALQDFNATAARTLELAADRRRVYPGIGVHLLQAPADLRRQVEVTRTLGTGGYCLFAYASFFPSPSHESRDDPASRRLRASMRQALLGITRGEAVARR